jgi:hypothetical protein
MIYFNTELTNTIVIQKMELWENIRLIPAADTIEDLYITLLLSIINLTNKLYK